VSRERKCCSTYVLEIINNVYRYKAEYLEVVVMARLGVKITSYLLVMTLVLIVLPLLPVEESSGGQGVMPTRRTIVVNASGGGDYNKIQNAIDAASDGDTVFVENGTYDEDLYIDISINLIGADKNNTIIEGYQTEIDIKSDEVLVSNFTIKKGEFGLHRTGINIYNVSKVTIENNICMDNYYGIEISHSKNIIIADNIILNNNRGIKISQSNNNNTLLRNNVSDNFIGISVLASDNNNIERNLLFNNSVGISIGHANTNYVHNNTIHNSESSGITISQSNEITLKNNSMLGNGLRIGGDELEYWNTHIIDTSNKVNGKSIYYWKNTNGGTIPTSAGQAIIVNCTDVVIKNLVIGKCNYGIQVSFSSSIIVKDNLIEEFDLVGINFVSSNNSTVKDNIISNGWSGICLRSSNWNSLSNNTILDNIEHCIYFKDSKNNYVNNNILMGVQDCIWIWNSKNTHIEENSMIGGGINVGGDLLCHSDSHTITSDNLINGKPVYYWKNRTGGIIPSNAGQIIVVNCTEINIEKCNMKGVRIGILITHSDHNNIINNTLSTMESSLFMSNSNNNTIKNNNVCSSDDDGIFLSSSNGNKIINNSAINVDSSGIDLSHSNNNIICNNTIINSNRSGIGLSRSNNNNVKGNAISGNNSRGLEICYSNNNSIVYNAISHNTNGLDFYGSSSNIVMCNNFQENDLFGIAISNNHDNSWISTNNSIFLNDFISNNNGNKQAEDNSFGNYWYTASQGNYWSEWTTPDTDEDAVVDDPYLLDGTSNAKDLYPLVAPMGITFPIAHAGNDVEVEQYQTVLFDSSLCIYTQFIENYTWNFNYEEKLINLYGPSPSFMFELAGIYNVTLTVINSIGQSTNDNVTVTVIDISPPTVETGPDIEIDQHQVVFFNASNSYDNVGIADYVWSFAYDTEVITLNGENIFFTFHYADSYVITLNITDAEGNWATNTLNVTVNDITAPTANAGPDITINQSETVEFFFHQNSSDNVGVCNWTWAFQYNAKTKMLVHSIPMSSLPSFTFDIPGNYSVTMTVYDSAGNWAIDLLNITVLNLSLPKEIDSDNDTYNNSFELLQGSDPYNPLSTPFDLDGDGWNNTVEIQVGSDPNNNLSIPQDMDTDGVPDSLDPDRDGDGVANVIDDYPDDGDRWERAKTAEKGNRAVWWIVGIVVGLIVIGVIVGVVLGTRKGEGGEEMKDDTVDELGRIGRDGGGEVMDEEVYS